MEPGYFSYAGSNVFTCKVPTTLADGEYALRIMFNETGDWILPDMAGGMGKNAIYFNLSGNMVTFNDGANYKKATSISEIRRTDSHSAVRYYDLQGREVDGSARGLLIRKDGSEVMKVMVK